ncbi:MAG TPA: flavin reductase family protein [Anaerolineales bacterium]|nr:flavin reductase family protein [Anaerolineales bacterium]
MEADPAGLPWRSVYKLLTGAIVPRPIAWVSTVDPAGAANLAPFSFFNAVSSRPPIVAFTASVRSTGLGQKDTLRNIRATGEFVVNIVTEPLAEAMNLTSTEFPPEVDEFQAAGLTADPSTAVTPPRVAESPIHFECRLHQIIEVGADPGGGALILGRVVHIHVDPSVLLGEDKIDIGRLRPIGRLAGAGYCRTGDTFEMIRPKSQLP